jgi:hypothetical protein
MAQATLVSINLPLPLTNLLHSSQPPSQKKNEVSERVGHQTNLRLIQHHGN